MPQTDHDRAIALAGILQTVDLVRGIARRGQANPEDVDTCLSSLLKIDAISSSDVYGGIDRLRPGLRLLERDGEHVLLSCKYGSGSVVGVQAILGLGKSATLRGAGNVIVATPGKFETEAMRVARQQGNIELLDGKDLWPELRPYIAREPATAVEPATAPTPLPASAFAIAWGGAAALGLVAWLLLQATQGEPPVSEAIATATAPATSQPAASPQPVATPSAQAVPTDPVALERRRKETANAISTLFGVDRALWSTQSTLLVYLSAEEADPSSELCPLLERYPELAASRVQLQPPPGSQKSVRFKQCRSY